MHRTEQPTREDWIAKGLEPLFRQQGFTWLPHLHQFRRSTADGFTCFILSTSDYEDVSLVEGHLGIRIDTVENLAFPFTNGLPGFHPDSMTLVCPLSKLFQQPFQRFELSDESSAKKVVATFLQQIQEEGIPFLQQYSELAEMHSLYNREPETGLYWLHNQANRCFRGIVLAKLMEPPGFENLADAYTNRLKSLNAPAPTLHKFSRLVAFLRHYSQN